MSESDLSPATGEKETTVPDEAVEWPSPVSFDRAFGQDPHEADFRIVVQQAGDPDPKALSSAPATAVPPSSETSPATGSSDAKVSLVRAEKATPNAGGLLDD